jgi:murein DD-endopeptidase MepM/ murein hydrolase activator NlpD
MTTNEESEGSYTYPTTTYPYELDFVQDSVSVSTPWFSMPVRIAKSILALAKTISISSLKVSWESVCFSVCYTFFVQRRAIAFIYFLESLKDVLVRVLMWRRGFLFRPTTHGGLLVLATIALVVGSLFRTGVASQDFSRDQVLAAENTPVTLIPEGRPRSEVVKYTVEKGDTISKIASIYKISANSIKWANGLEDVDKIKPGDVLAIPPVTGVAHKVKKGDTLASLAKKYRADAQTIATYPFNYIDDTLKLRIGQTLIVPGGRIPPPTSLPGAYSAPSHPIFYAAGGSGIFAWPVKGSLNQYPSWWHPAIDIGAAYGSAVRAATGGKVVTAGWNGYGFGNYVVVSHNNGYTTSYAHLGSISTSAGQTVSKGQLLGTVGCTGFCTGSHLHFEVHRGSRSVNPLSLLP